MTKQLVSMSLARVLLWHSVYKFEYLVSSSCILLKKSSIFFSKLASVYSSRSVLDSGESWGS